MMNALTKVPTLTFGELLRVEREKQGLTHRDLSQRCGVDKTVVAAWEKNAAVPDRQQLKRIFGSCQRLRHYVHLLPQALQESARVDARQDGVELPKQLAPIAVQEPPPATFGEALRSARLHEGLDQEELGELIAVSGQAVSYWELNQVSPILAHYDALLNLLPRLRDAPKPAARDITKPGFPAGSPAPERNDPVNRPAPAAPQSQSTPANVGNILRGDTKQALIRWGRLIHALKVAENAYQFTELLAVAKHANMTLDEVIAALEDP